jgi:large subunit ribosomal protein L23
MGLFNKKKDDKDIEKSTKSRVVSDTKKVEKEVKKTDKKTEKVLQQDVDGSLAYKFILRPWITEKTHDLMASNKYVFKLRQKVTKNQAKNAVEKLYGVEVKKVNIINIPQKKRRFGRVMGKKSGIRKAIVTLKEGNKIEVFE